VHRDGLNMRCTMILLALLLGLGVSGCTSTRKITPESLGPASVTVPVTLAGVRDERARFRAIYCALDAGCEDRLRRLADEPPASPLLPPTATSVMPLSTQPATGTLAQSSFVGPESKEARRRRLKVLYVLGFGSDCAGQPRLIEQEMQPFLAVRGYRMQVATVSGLGSSASNALALRDTILAAGTAQEPVVIIGHSKGAVDALQVLVDYPQVRSRVAALVSLAGAIGGSPLADRAPTSVQQVAAAIPGLDCSAGDLGAIESLRPAVRQTWLARHRLPSDVRMYSVVTLPHVQRLSPGLMPTYRLLRRIDPRNDGNLLSRDQIIPGSTLVAYLDADHWAVGSDLSASTNPIVRAAAGNQSFPRRTLIEAVLTLIEQDLASPNHLPKADAGHP